MKYLLLLFSLIVFNACSDDEVMGPSVENFKTDNLGIQGNAYFYRIPDDSSRYLIYALGSITSFYDSIVVEGAMPVLYLYLVDDSSKVTKSESYEGVLVVDKPLFVYEINPEEVYGKVDNIQPNTRTFIYMNSDTLKYVDYPIYQIRYTLGLRFNDGLSKRVQGWESVKGIKELNSC